MYCDPYYKLLAEWREAVEKLDELKNLELDLRKKLFAGAFPAPSEGTQRVTLLDGTVLKGSLRLNRRIDPEALQEVNLPEEIKSRVVRMKPELDIKMYRTLCDEDRAKFDACLTIKPGTPTLEIETEKVKK